MKQMLVAAALAASTLAGVAAVPAAANAQVVVDYGRPYHGPNSGPRWHAWRQGYYGANHRYPARVCERHRHRTVCYYR